MDDSKDPGRNSLIYESSKVDWATSEFIEKDKFKIDRIFFYVLFVLILILIAFSTFTYKSKVVSASGVVVPKSQSVVVFSTSNSTIKELNFSDNSKVKKGDIILKFDSYIPLDQIEKIKSMSKLLTNLELLKVEKKGMQKVRFFSFQRMASEYSSDSQFLSTFGKADQAKGLFFNSLNSYFNQDNELESLRFDLEQVKSNINIIKTSRAQSELVVEIKRLRSQQLKLENQINKKQNDIERSLNSSHLELINTLRALDAILETNNKNSVITSPVDGVLSFEQGLNKGQILQKGSKLGKITPVNSDLVLSIQVTNKDVGEIKKNHPLKIDFHALPARSFGVYETKIDKIKAQTIDQKDIQNSRGQITEKFNVIGVIEKKYIERNNTKHMIKVGMTFDAKVVIGHDRLIVFIYKQLLNIKDEKFGEIL